MIIKSFDLSKLKINKHKFYLFYGDNEGLKEEIIKNLFEKNYFDKNYFLRVEDLPLPLLLLLLERGRRLLLLRPEE